MNMRCPAPVTAGITLSITAMAALAGTGHWRCDDGLYSEVICWEDDFPGDLGDVAVVDHDNFGVPYTLDMDLNVNVGSVNVESPDATFLIDDNQLNFLISLNILPSATVRLKDGDIVGTGIITNGGNFDVRQGTSLIDIVGFDNNNSMTMLAPNAPIDLTINNSMFNAASMSLDGSCCGNSTITLTMGPGAVMTNGGLVTVNPSGGRFLRGMYANQGTFAFNTGATFDQPGTLFASESAVSIASGATLRVETGAVMTTTDGAVDGLGTLRIGTDGTMNFNGGGLFGDVLVTQGGTFNFGPASPGVAAIRFNTGTNTLTGDIGSAQSVRIEAPSNANTTVMTVADFVNAGLVEFAVPGCCAGSAFLDLAPGTMITNLGTVDFTPGAGAIALRGDVLNEGAYLVRDDVPFDRPGALLTNRDTLAVDDGATFTIDGTTLLQEAGMIDGLGRVFVTSDGLFDFDGGDVLADVELRSSTLDIDAASFGAGAFRFRIGQSTLLGDIAAAQSVHLQAPGNANTTVIAPFDFTNQGILDFEVEGCCAGSTFLDLGDGMTFTNLGTVQFINSPGTKSLRGNVVNEGDYLVDDAVPFDRPGATFVNRGLFSVAETETFTVDGTTFRNEDGGSAEGLGRIFVTNGGTFDFAGGDVTAGVELRSSTLIIDPAATSPAAFRFFIGTSSLDGDVAAGQTLLIESPGNGTTTVTTPGDFTSAGLIQLNGLACCNGQTIIDAAPGAVFTNLGTVDFTDSPGTKRIRNDVVNEGTMLVQDSTAFDEAETIFLNRGLLRIFDGENFVLNNDSTLRNELGGVIDGTGLINAEGDTFINAAVVAPGTSAGELRFRGVYTQTIDGTLAIEVGGLVPDEEHDQLAFTGAVRQAELAGTLEISLIDGFSPEIGDSITIIDNTTSITGSFDAVISPLAVDVAYDATGVVVTFQETFGPADLDQDGDVDVTDLLVLLAAWGPCDPPPAPCVADITLDGTVDIADLLTLLAAWG